MFDKILIANRGEIACRIIKTSRRLGIRTIVVYSEPDASLPFVRDADEAILIGPAAARQSYLDPSRILAAAAQTNAAAIHPGYGFLSENAAFAETVQQAGFVWIGAPPAAIRAMGLKDAAKELMQQAGVPVTPGHTGQDQTAERLSREAGIIGYPVLIKAIAGGGGKGMRRVDEASAFADALDSCRREALSSFGDDRVLIEKYIQSPRHIEVQVFGDTFGNVIHLFERDCSLQRRHQKVIEEAPAPGMDDQTRRAVCEAAVKAAKAVNYVGAGTIEFIADSSDGLRADRIWFMEMNTRLQVEHPVTEAITGQDLVEWQLRIAAGEALPCRQEDLSINGWAMEGRLYAENPATGFLPTTGSLERLRFPHQARIDSGVEEGDEITPYYDPMIAKVIVHGGERAEAARALSRAADAIEVYPLKTNAGFLSRAASHPDFIAGRIDTGFIERHLASLVPETSSPAIICETAAKTLFDERPRAHDPWSELHGFRLNADREDRVWIEVGGVRSVVSVPDTVIGLSPVTISGERVLFMDGEAWPFSAPVNKRVDGSNLTGDGTILAPMPGLVLAVNVAEGESVTAGQKLVLIEAMKMEMCLQAPFAGVVTGLTIRPGMKTVEGAALLRIEREAE